MSNAVIQQSRFYNAEDVANILDVSLSSAYRIMKRLNKELEEKGFITVAGKISRKYFEMKVML
ncbi:helix-turn-helix domain-containing protein [Clostridiisalibacter paucivorans]|uniref:helix-turn-helix domain-containing protein n=1 Tax=Clostridiisalibacter paucivorans TaxID=408753 RepID=UPI000551D020|nr:helix-turn-helix domain-containing protein [Clostridiisalibacter paucivorans]